MRTSLQAGRIFGIPLHLHWTLLLVVGWVFYDGYSPAFGLRWGRITWVGGVILLLFGFVLVHELGHALTARYYGKKTDKILLFPLGGGAYIREHPDRLYQEILVYLGGPLANLGLALLAFPLLVILSPDWLLLLRYYLQPQANLVVAATWWEDLLRLTISVNVVLMVLNLLPAYPLDGGRILQALLRGPLGKRRASIVVSVLGISAGIVFLVLAYFLRDPLMGTGGLFVAGLSVAELNAGWQRRRLQQHVVTELVRPIIPERLYVEDTIAYARRQLNRSDWPVLPVYDRWNEVSGLLHEELLEDARESEDIARVASIYDPAVAACRLEESLLDATITIIETDSYGALVYDQQRPVGFLLMDDVMKLLEKRWRRSPST